MNFHSEQSSKINVRHLPSNSPVARKLDVLATILLGLALSGCVAPIGAVKTTTERAYRQIHDNPVSHGQLSRETRSVLHRFQQTERFEKAPDDTLQLIQKRAVED